MLGTSEHAGGALIVVKLCIGFIGTGIKAMNGQHASLSDAEAMLSLHHQSGTAL